MMRLRKVKDFGRLQKTKLQEERIKTASRLGKQQTCSVCFFLFYFRECKTQVTSRVARKTICLYASIEGYDYIEN